MNMNARDNILKTISTNKPPFIPAPELVIDRPSTSDIDLVQLFSKTLESIGGKAILVNGYHEIKDEIEQSEKQGYWIVNTITEAGEINKQLDATIGATQLENVHKAFIKGTIGVAENGAIWVKESQAVNRLLPFICQHLVLVINAADIVPTLHEAYRQINIAEEGWGVFIAGPSKTADIEQSLVIGAHGARSLAVYLVN
jgi:L-lactate dehydrogenase complex protein LldG